MTTFWAACTTILAMVTIATYARANKLESSKNTVYPLLATAFFVATATCLSIFISLVAGATASKGLVTGLIISVGLQFSPFRSKWTTYKDRENPKAGE